MPNNPIESINAALTESERLCAGATEGVGPEHNYLSYNTVSGTLQAGTGDIVAYVTRFVDAVQFKASRTRWPNETAALRCAVEALKRVADGESSTDSAHWIQADIAIAALAFIAALENKHGK